MTRGSLALRVPAAAALVVVAALAMPPSADAQHSITSPAGDTLTFELSELRSMLETARALYTDLEEDPRVLYRLGFGPAVRERTRLAAYPWNAVQPQSDSVVNVVTPGNLREADRAYHNYAVMRMREIRSEDPDDPCDALVEREERVLSSFVDGWILSRTLFGGPGFAPLDEMVFARADGHLGAFLAARGDTAVGGCAEPWREAHPDAVAAYEAWREAAFPGLAALPPDSTAAEPEATPDPPGFLPPGEDDPPEGEPSPRRPVGG